MRLVVRGQRLGDLGEPLVQQLGRARFSEGMEPTMPAWHCAITSLGLLMMNSGEPMTGRRRLLSAAGRERRLI
jgi:hypothetical protein